MIGQLEVYDICSDQRLRILQPYEEKLAPQFPSRLAALMLDLGEDSKNAFQSRDLISRRKQTLRIIARSELIISSAP